MNKKICKIGVIGAGSWGTTLAAVVKDRGHDVTLWVYEQELLEILENKHRNTFYLPDVELKKKLKFTGSIKEAVEEKEIILWVTPVKNFRETFNKGLAFSSPNTIHVCASKGIENNSLERISQIAEEINSGFTEKGFAVLSGPSFAKETSQKMPTAVVLASRDIETAKTVQRAMATPYFRTYTSTDLAGVELGGALKNVIAVASGIVEGLGFGNNTRAALITRGLAEIIRLGKRFGADERTFAGLSGMGDLVLTCTSSLSRNFSVGRELGKGRKLSAILDEMNMVAEGVYTTRAVQELSEKHRVKMPIVNEVYKILFEDKQPMLAVKDLMSRELKNEII